MKLSKPVAAHAATGATSRAHPELGMGMSASTSYAAPLQARSLSWKQRRQSVLAERSRIACERIPDRRNEVGSPGIFLSGQTLTEAGYFPSIVGSLCAMQYSP